MNEDPDDWLEELMRAHLGSVRAYAARRVGPDAADDVAAEVFSTAWQRRTSVPSQALPWLLKCAHYKVLHASDKKIRQQALIRQLADQQRANRHGQDYASLYDALAALREDQREILYLEAWEGLSLREIATVIDCSYATARVRLFRARRALLSKLQSLDGKVVRETVEPRELASQS